MPVKNSEDLFQLIKSLTRQEKRYFKLFASRNMIKDNNNYIKLFDAIEKQKQVATATPRYDEKQIRESFANERFINNLPVTKFFLHKLILKSLRAYHAENSIDLQLKELLAYTEILYQKALYTQCSKVLDRAKKIAYKYEKHLQILEILQWELQIQKGEFNIKKLNEILAEEKKMLLVYKNSSEYHGLNLQIHSLLQREGIVRRQDHLKKIEKIIDHPLLSNEAQALSMRAKDYYYNIYSGYFALKDDAINRYKYNKNHVALIESNPEQITENLQSYIAVLNNFAVACGELKKYDEELHIIEKLRAIPQKYVVSEAVEVKIFSLSYNLELNLYLKTKHFEKGIALVGEIEKGLKQFSGKIPKEYELFFYYNIAELYFSVSNYSEALDWLNKILNDREVDIRPDIHCFARIFNLIIHYELGNYDLVEYRSKSTHYFLDKKQRLYKVESSFLNFFQKKLPKIIGQKELVAAFKDLKKEIEEIVKDPLEHRALEYFDFISWVDGKIVS